MWAWIHIHTDTHPLDILNPNGCTQIWLPALVMRDGLHILEVWDLVSEFLHKLRGTEMILEPDYSF